MLEGYCNTIMVFFSWHYKENTRNKFWRKSIGKWFFGDKKDGKNGKDNGSIRDNGENTCAARKKRDASGKCGKNGSNQEKKIGEKLTETSR